MGMKKGVIFGFLFLVLVFSVFVSAFSFSDLFKTTGKATWEITEPTGVCLSNTIDQSLCLYNSISECTPTCSGEMTDLEYLQCAQQTNCRWDDDYVEVSDSLINVNQGWNLMWGFFYPGFMSSSNDLTPNNVKGIYIMNPLERNYIQMYPIVDTTGIDSISGNYVAQGYYPGIGKGDSSFLVWVYFDKAGSFKFRLPEGFKTDIYNTCLFSGWNFVGILPGVFYDTNGVNQISFKLNDIKGNCNIEKAYFFGGTNENPSVTNEWVEVGVNNLISDAEMYGALAVQVTSDCILGRTNNQKTCEDSDGSMKLNVKGTVTIKDNLGSVISTETDFCQTDDSKPNFGGLIEKHCDFDSAGRVIIKTTEIPTGSSWCNSCSDGVCV